jgi:hypothetical protein
MKSYFLLRDGVSIGHTTLAAIFRKDRPELLEWLGGEKEYRVLEEHEFERAKRLEGAIVLTWKSNEDIAIALGPRPEWPEAFHRLRNYFEESANRREERVNITEARWFAQSDRPKDLANFALPQMSDRTIRLFAVPAATWWPTRWSTGAAATRWRWRGGMPTGSHRMRS